MHDNQKFWYVIIILFVRGPIAWIPVFIPLIPCVTLNPRIPFIPIIVPVRHEQTGTMGTTGTVVTITAGTGSANTRAFSIAKATGTSTAANSMTVTAGNTRISSCDGTNYEY